MRKQSELHLNWTMPLRIGRAPRRRAKTENSRASKFQDTPQFPFQQETDAKILLLNPEENPCYFSFELILDETGESLFTSKMVEPGKAIQEETLSRALEAGEYDATIKISTYSLDTNTQMNGANVKTKLLVG